MNREQFDAWESRIKAQADQLWRQAGSPDGQRDRFSEQARELLAIKENPDSGTLDPDDAARPVIEEAALMRNLGEFPTLTDQGDEMTYPDDLAPGFPETDLSDDRDIHLSDDDAADDGGVLPLENTPASGMPDISVADADITTDTTDADVTAPRSGEVPGDADLNDADLNDDGLPDQPGFFRTAGRRSK